MNKNEVSKSRSGPKAWHIILLALVALWVVCDLQKVGGPLHRDRIEQRR
jgi:hypothetical protein